MKKTLILFLLILFVNLSGKAQALRYFQFSTNCGHGNWQDLSFVAATSDQKVIDTVLANINRPLGQRKFISGAIDYGNGGFNYNMDHWFLWHFVPNQWDLVEMAIEVCDGCPYTDLDADTAYWVGNIGVFCPWSGKPVAEVSTPSSIHEINPLTEVNLYPNPTQDKLKIHWTGRNDMTVVIYNSLGEDFSTINISQQDQIIDLTNLHTGIYFLKFTSESRIQFQKVIKN